MDFNRDHERPRGNTVSPAIVSEQITGVYLFHHLNLVLKMFQNKLGLENQLTFEQSVPVKVGPSDGLGHNRTLNK